MNIKIKYENYLKNSLTLFSNLENLPVDCTCPSWVESDWGKMGNVVWKCCKLNLNLAIHVSTRAQRVVNMQTRLLHSMPSRSSVTKQTHSQTNNNTFPSRSLRRIECEFDFSGSGAVSRVPQLVWRWSRAELWLTVRREQTLADRNPNKGKCQFACVTCRRLTRGKEKLKMKHSCQFRSTAGPRRF